MDHGLIFSLNMTIYSNDAPYWPLPLCKKSNIDFHRRSLLSGIVYEFIIDESRDGLRDDQKH